MESKDYHTCLLYTSVPSVSLHLLNVSTRTLQRMRSEQRIGKTEITTQERDMLRAGLPVISFVLRSMLM